MSAVGVFGDFNFSLPGNPICKLHINGLGLPCAEQGLAFGQPKLDFAHDNISLILYAQGKLSKAIRLSEHRSVAMIFRKWHSGIRCFPERKTLD
jgi:hypothetical protein